MEKRIVIKVNVHNDKSRSRALRTAASYDGVTSVALDGDDKVVVVGKGIDVADLTYRLMRKFKYASIETVELVNPDELPPEEEMKPNFEGYFNQSMPPPQYYYQPSYMIPYRDPHYPPDSCSIL